MVSSFRVIDCSSISRNDLTLETDANEEVDKMEVEYRFQVN
jgi:hypothetical protein